jgi:DNA (cytosine-5)-methyltransferase 1
MNEELDLFSFCTPRFHIGDKPIRLIEMFAGIGCQAKALKNLGVEFEHWRVIEIDQNPINSYNAIFNTDFKPQDISQVHGSDLGITDRENYCYITTYSFPCQDLSLAGKQKGMEKGSGTRSGLLWEVERILNECSELDCLPQILIMENVPQVVGTKNIKSFQDFRRRLEKLGYSNYVQLLNSKDYGIPQNRNRCFMVSLLGDWHYTFPKKKKLELRLKDMLEDKVDEKYYLSEKAMNGIVNTSYQSGRLESRVEKDGVMSSLRARDYKDPKLAVVGNYSPSGHESARIVEPTGLSPTVKENHGTVTAICEGGHIKND